MALPLFMLCFIGIAFLIIDSRAGRLKKLNEKLRRGPYGSRWVGLVRKTRLVIGLFAGGLFLTVTVIHICTWLFDGMAPYVNSFMWLHLWVLLAFIAAAYFSHQKRKPGDRKNYLRGMPKWANTTMTVLGVYMISLLGMEMFRHHGSYSIHERDDRHYIVTDEQPEREMTAAEYAEHQVQNLRTFSGFWMGFSFCAAGYLLFARDQEEKPLGLPYLQ